MAFLASKLWLSWQAAAGRAAELAGGAVGLAGSGLDSWLTSRARFVACEGLARPGRKRSHHNLCVELHTMPTCTFIGILQFGCIPGSPALLRLHDLPCTEAAYPPWFSPCRRACRRGWANRRLHGLPPGLAHGRGCSACPSLAAAVNRWRPMCPPSCLGILRASSSADVTAG